MCEIFRILSENFAYGNNCCDAVVFKDNETFLIGLVGAHIDCNKALNDQVAHKVSAWSSALPS